MGAPADSISGKWHGGFRAAGGDHDVAQFITLQESGTTLGDARRRADFEKRDGDADARVKLTRVK